VRLDPGTTKNREGRVVYLPPEALAALKAWDEQTRQLERERNIIVRSVFHRDGESVRDLYAAWRSACDRAGVPGMLFHDLRRTAARNYVRSGNHESVVMRISATGRARSSTATTSWPKMTSARPPTVSQRGEMGA
jgi:integrase